MPPSKHGQAFVTGPVFKSASAYVRPGLIFHICSTVMMTKLIV